MSDTPALSLRDVSVTLGRQNVLTGVSLELSAGQTASLVGPSGCGKTTLLRAVSGLSQLDNGSIRIDGVTVATAERGVPPEKRGVGMVFQDLALFPHLSVEQNILFGLTDSPREAARARCRELLDMTGLAGHSKRLPHQLSGGQQQRVALARALANRPRLLLLDECFSSLDPELREQLLLETRQWIRREGITAVLVTHDRREAFVFGERLGVLESGRLLQWADPVTLQFSPATPFVSTFLSQRIPVRVTCLKPGLLETPLGELAHSGVTPGEYMWHIGEGDLRALPSGGTRLPIVQSHLCGHLMRHQVALSSGETLTVDVPAVSSPPGAASLQVSFSEGVAVIFDAYGRRV
jgi:iron(III) transport system ATP-binding protein